MFIVSTNYCAFFRHSEVNYSKTMIKRYLYYLRTCTLCQNKIRVCYLLCKECNILYGKYIEQPWFIDLMKQQKRQDAIDSREVNPPKSSKNKGRPPINHKIVEHILSIYDNLEEDEIISLRSIQSALSVPVNHETIRNILLRYRKEKYCLKNKR